MSRPWISGLGWLEALVPTGKSARGRQSRRMASESRTKAFMWGPSSAGENAVREGRGLRRPSPLAIGSRDEGEVKGERIGTSDETSCDLPGPVAGPQAARRADLRRTAKMPPRAVIDQIAIVEGSGTAAWRISAALMPS